SSCAPTATMQDGYKIAGEEFTPVLSELKKITNTLTYTIDDIKDLETGYIQFIQEFGRNNRTVPAIRELCQLQALYLDNIDTAITIMSEIVQMGGLKKDLLGNCKLDLGDYYLVSGDVWESTLLYSQVDKTFKDGPLGELARFKNAKLSYFKGEFDWSQAQLNILKAATSELIANDALDLSIFILDNLGLDSTLTPMQMYSKAELLSFQNKHDVALKVLDSIITFFPGHPLEDDIYFVKAKTYLRKMKFDQAIEYLDRILNEYPGEILGDDANFLLAEVYQYQKKDLDKARNLYERIILEYKGSLYSVEARKRYRKLRGDNLN
ncbi:MAG: tetratricopeptide repeat protein, partial [Bacteroidetes bacterium]|nr:tetratricopeptide repeat protein [Bacteroidota bacterium]